MILRLFIVLGLISLILGAPLYAQPEARFSGEVTEDSRVRLMWKVTAWTSDLEGFSIKRKLVTEPTWQGIGPAIIYPGYHDRNWGDYGVSAGEIKELAAALDRYTEGGANPLPAEQAIDRLQEFGGVPVGTLISFNRNYFNAIVGGFGFIDSNTGGKKYRYGLFPVFSGERIAEEPVSTFSAREYLEQSELSASDLKATYKNGKCRISWALSREVYAATGIIGYKIYVKNSDGPEFTALFDRPQWRGDKDNNGGSIQFEYFDQVSPKSKSVRVYAIEAHTAFGGTLPRKRVLCEVHPEVKPPHSLKHTRMKDGSYELSWIMPEVNLSVEGLSIDVQRVIIEDFNELSEVEKIRGEVMSKPYDLVESGLPVDAGGWIDDLRVKESTRVSYRISIKDSNGETMVTSSAELSSIRPNILPLPVENLKPMLKPSPRKSGLIARLEWEHTSEAGAAIDYFSVSSGESPDRLVRHASYNNSQKFFEKQVSGEGNERFFQVVPVAENGLEGEPRLVSLYLPKTRLDPFPKDGRVAYEPRLNELESTIRWEYGDSRDLSGFRIRHLNTKEIIADTDQLEPDTREWVWRGEMLKSEERIPIKIEAIGVFDYITSMPEVAYLDNSPQHVKRNYSLPKAEFSEVSLYDDGDKRILVLKWSPWDQELYSEVARLGIGPGGPDENDKVSLYRISWHKYREAENGKLVVELSNDLKGEVPMRLIPLYPDEHGRPIIKGRFAEFTVNFDDAAEGEPDAGDDAEAAESKVPLGEALQWETRLIEEEASFSDEFMTGVFAFKNVGPNPVEIKKIKSSCGCTTVQLDKRLYLPGESGEIVALFEFEGRTGRQTKVVDVYVEGYEEPVRLTLRTTIPKVLSVKPAFQTWASGAERSPKYSVLEVEVDGLVQITEVKSSDPRLSAEFETTEEGKAYRLKLTPEASEEKFNATVSVKTNYPIDNPKSYPVKIQVR